MYICDDLRIEADPRIEMLAELTDGKSYFVHDWHNHDALRDAFVGALTYQTSIGGDLHVKLLEAPLAKSSHSYMKEFVVDPTIGRQLRLSVIGLQNLADLESIELTKPDGKVANTTAKVDGNTPYIQIDAAEV